MENEKKWPHKVTETSEALDLPKGLFKLSPKEIAKGLKRSAMESGKGDPYQSAMSMLNFYINRAGKNLSSSDKNRLELVKNELRKVFGREPEENE
jgi:Protein of unknown function (DUF3175)